MAKKKQKDSKEVNIKLLADQMIITAHVVKEKDSILESPTVAATFLDVQQVLAIGPHVRDVKVGDWIYLDYQQFETWVEKQSDSLVGVGGGKRKVQEMRYPYFAIPGDNTPYFKIGERNIEGIIEDYSKLPVEYKDFDTIEEFTKRRDKLAKELDSAKKAFKSAATKEYPASIAPATFAEGIFRK